MTVSTANQLDPIDHGGRVNGLKEKTPGSWVRREGGKGSRVAEKP